MRVYLDHNATAPLRAEARAAMHAAMDLVGNPSSVHAEGRAAKGLVERARAQVAALVGCGVNQVIFTSGATEAAALAAAQKSRHGGCLGALATEHDCLLAHADTVLPAVHRADGTLVSAALREIAEVCTERHMLVAWSAANSETGITGRDFGVTGNMALPTRAGDIAEFPVVCDITQLAGKVPLVHDAAKPEYAILSAHKFGGPKGVGALINFTSRDPDALIRGGGQEMGRRSGTENVIGIAGFGAAAEAAARDVATGRWTEIAELRDLMETALEAASNTTILVGKDAPRLPNTSCILTPGWKGETQVMQMDLAGFAISAGSACSSGKVRASAVLGAMGYDDIHASSAIRVSLGLDTTKDEVLRFADAWTARLKKHEARAA